MPSGPEFVGEYRLFHMIRAGATFEVWAVRQLSETTVYAIKWLPKGAKHTRQAVAELRHEFEVGRSLVHPSVIKTYEFNAAKEGAYLRMELFKTLNLKQQIVANRRGLMHRAKDILVNCASGLAHMHEKGWVHRDIKPDNFLVRDDNEVRLIDFTIAAKPSGGLGKLLGMRTKVQGTYSYMSPEQIRGQGVDPRDDVYSFGCMIHELLSGGLPFTANSPAELLQRHLRGKPPLLTVADKNVTPDFAAYVQRMLAKERSERPDSMREVLVKLKTERMFYINPEPLATDEDAAKRKPGQR